MSTKHRQRPTMTNGSKVTVSEKLRMTSFVIESKFNELKYVLTSKGRA